MAASALALVLTDLEPIVGSIRRWYDPAAAMGVPPHITLLYPWREPPLMGEQLQAVQSAVGGFKPYTITFRGVGRFERTLYLQPDDGGETKALISTLAAHFPDYAPYAGQVTTVVPHLTVAEVGGDLGPILTSQAPSLLAALPVSVEVQYVSVLESRDDGRWVVAARIPFAGA